MAGSTRFSEAPRFSETLRTATREAHTAAETSAFVRKLLSGTLPIGEYAKLATQYYFIYTALEDLAESMRADPVAGPFVIDELRRVPALTEDLDFLLGPSWKVHATPNASTLLYCHRLRSVARNWPAGFVAHHYTRYLGDLAGGRIIYAKLRRHYGIDGPGTYFYVFDAIPNPAEFRRRYRALLDTAAWTADERAQIITESRNAFALNTAVFTELDTHLGR